MEEMFTNSGRRVFENEIDQLRYDLAIAKKTLKIMNPVFKAALRYILNSGEDPSDWRDSLDALKDAVSGAISSATHGTAK